MEQQLNPCPDQDRSARIDALAHELYGYLLTPEGREIARYYAEAILDELERPLPPPSNPAT